MNELPVWWLAVEVVGLAAFPLTFVFFRWLPDRGVTLAKVVGLLLLGYGFWMSAVLGLMPPSRGSVIVVLVLIAGVSWAAGSRHRYEIKEYLRSGWRYILLAELMFLAVLAAAVYLRSFAPEIDSGEKPFELAFLNAVNRAESFPPEDPWLSGENISYYYFGYVIVAALSKLAFLQTSVTFFLGLSTVAALVWVAIFGLVYNLVKVARGETTAIPGLSPRPVIFGVLAAVLVLIVGNLEGVFELMARHGVGGEGFYGLVGIHGLQAPYDCETSPADCAEWYPTRYYWWWWATRIGSPADIQEFPFFSLHFGDLHAHVLVMPLLLVLFATVFQMALAARDENSGRTLGSGWLVRHPGRALIIVLLLGGIAFTDAWAVPLAITLVAVGVLLANWLCGVSPARVLIDSAAFLAPVVTLAFVLYLPYYLDLEADRDGIAITQTAKTTAGDPPENSESTRPLHFALFWAPMLVSVLTFAAPGVWRSRGCFRDWRLTGASTLPAVLPLLVWIVWSVANDGLRTPFDEAGERAEDLLTIAFLMVTVTAVTLLFLRSLDRPTKDRGAVPFIWLLAGFALLMLYGAELFYVQDEFDWRANTVFRFWHEAWIILGIVSAFALYRLTLSWPFPRVSVRSVPLRHATIAALTLGVAYSLLVAVDPWETLYDRWWTATPGLMVGGLAIVTFVVSSALENRTLRRAWLRLLWVGATGVVFSAALVYPVLVVFDRTGGFTDEQTLDGLAFVDPFEREAIQWLNENVEGTPVILEAFGDDFSGSGRVSSRTGLPTVIGWLNHERQWRGDPDPLGAGDIPFTIRPQEVDRLYNTPVIGEAQIFIDKYEIEYVYVGSLERATYSLDGIIKFRQFMDIAFENGGVTIYQVRDNGVTSARID